MCMKIAVVGANSYIARNLTMVLGDSNRYELKLYDREAEHLDGRSDYRRVNMLDENSVSIVDLNCDIIYMFTGKTGSIEGFDNYKQFIEVNEIALLNLLGEYVRQSSHAKIIFPSTRLVYKGVTGKLKEDAPKEYRSVYAVNKMACEEYLRLYQRVFGVRYCIFRICIPYGTLIPGASSYGTVGFMLGNARAGKDIKLYGHGEVRRTLTHIADLCRILELGALSDKCLNDVFNVGGEDYSLAEMAKLIANQYGVDIVYEEWPELAYLTESGNTVFDSEKLEKCIGNCYNMEFERWCNSGCDKIDS